MTRLNLDDPDVLLSSALRASALAASLESVVRSGARAAQEAESEAREIVQRLSQAVSTLRTQLGRCTDVQVQSRLRAELGQAENRLAEGQQLSRMVSHEVQRVSDRHVRFLARQSALVAGLTQVHNEMVHDVEKARAILAARPVGGFPVGAASSSSSVGARALRPVGSTGLTMVSLDEVTDPIDHVRGPSDFGKMPMSDMQVALNLLEGKVLPAVDSGARREDMVALDAALGWAERPVNHARTFDLFFGSDRMVLSPRSSGYSVTNGAHRIWLARRMGITHLPATTDGRLEGS